MAEAKGAMNRYVCQKCGNEVVTTLRDEGTTPFMIPCDQLECGGVRHSCFYTVSFPIRKPDIEFYRPSDEEIVTYVDAFVKEKGWDEEDRASLLREARAYVDNGCLLYRRLNDGS
jgi:hypothetical protein